jgi:hypothetical protein
LGIYVSNCKKENVIIIISLTLKVVIFNKIYYLVDCLNVIYLYSTLKPIAMKKVAKLVTVSFTTRMIVDESASESRIIELSKNSLTKLI